jgi:hypothetical protein
MFALDGSDPMEPDRGKAIGSQILCLALRASLVAAWLILLTVDGNRARLQNERASL